MADVYEKLAPQARFLGDLYQDLSEQARKKYALLANAGVRRGVHPRPDPDVRPRRVRAEEPADDRPDLRLWALPARRRSSGCFDEWCKPETASTTVVAAQNALDGVWGVDINPFAVAIARFRLLVAAVHACGIKRLHQQSYAMESPPCDRRQPALGEQAGRSKASGCRIAQQGKLFEVDPIYAVEDPAALREVLGQGYHVVVGNPPYITVKDKAQNEAYRRLYRTCHRQYSLGVPFTQRFWELAIQQGDEAQRGSQSGRATSA